MTKTNITEYSEEEQTKSQELAQDLSINTIRKLNKLMIDLKKDNYQAFNLSSSILMTMILDVVMAIQDSLNFDLEQRKKHIKHFCDQLYFGSSNYIKDNCSN